MKTTARLIINKIVLKNILFFIFLSFASSFSQTKLASFFSDGMVLQQKSNVAIWGHDAPNTIISVTSSWGNISSVKTSDDGLWKLKIETPNAGGPFTLSVKGSQIIEIKDVMIGEVWLCSGQSNMEMPLKGFFNQPVADSQEAILNSKNNNIRVFSTKRATSFTPQDDVIGDWKIANSSNAPEFSATAYFFGKRLESILNVPVGLIVTSWGASTAEAWIDKETLSQMRKIEIPSELYKNPQKTPTVLFNGMLNPFLGYCIKGAIWYQGESNRDNANEYGQLINLMVNSWREKWGQGKFPFYFVQIAPFDYVEDVNTAFLREAQFNTMTNLENTGMAVTLDIGDCNCIHPSNKIEVGDRLAYWALAKDYGFETIEYTGPIYKEMKVLKDGKIEIYFESVKNGITSFGKPLIGFEISGEDRMFYPAEATIVKNKSIVSLYSEKVKNPIAVRYAFENCSKGTLFSTSGLPASSFRTDTWDK